jgi:CRP-like cAMP-binding protein/chromosome segregation ATPase
MAVPDSKNDDALLRNLVPLNTLSDRQLGKLLSRIKVEKAKKGTYLFREGDTDHQNVYLISGTVALLSGQKEIDLVTSGTPTARFALAHQLPRKHSARAKSAVNFVRIDSRMLSGLLARSQNASYEVNEDAAPGKSDWMGLLLQSPVFQQIPPANLQRVMMRMEEIEVYADDVIIQQGDEGDYFYLISRGLCRVSRQPAPDRPPVELAQLKAGQGFGEESLISGKPRGSTVTMLTDGTLVRLSKKDFADLVKEHLSQTVSYDEACRIVEEGGLWLDVRTPEEYEQGHLPGALNLPFFSLRFQASSLAADRVYVLYGEEVGQSATGAYLLKERGLETYLIGQDWNLIAVEAGLREGESLNKLDNVIEFNREAAAAAEQQVEAGTVQEEAAKEVIEALRKRLVETEQAYREQLEQRTAEATSLKQTLTETTHRLEMQEQDSRAAVTALETQLEELRSNLAEAKNQLVDTKAVSKREQQLRKDINRLEKNLETLSRESAEAEKAATEAREARNRLEAQLKTTQSEHETDLKSLHNELAELREQLEAVTASRQEQQQRAGEETGALRDELSALQTRLQELEGAKQSLSTEKSQLLDELTSLKSRMGEVSGEAQQKIADLEAKLEQEHQTAEFLRRSLATAEDAVEISAESLDESESERQAASKQLSELQAEVTRLGAVNEKAQAQLDELKGSLEASEKARLELVSAQEANSQALEQEKAELLASIAQAKANQADQEARHRQTLEQLASEKTDLAKQLAESKALLEDKEQSFSSESSRSISRINELEQSLAETRAQLQKAAGAGDEAQEAMQALKEARDQIKQQEQTIAELREVQLEMESRQGEDSMEELDELRGRLEAEERKRKEFEELAGKAAFLRREREVQETAVEMLTEDLDQLGRDNEKLAQERDAIAGQLAELRTQFGELLDENNHLHSEVSDFKDQAGDGNKVEDLLLQIDELREQADEYERERDVARVESDRMKREIRELRGVIETYVEQIQDVQSFGASEETKALRSELDMVRRQASEDLEQMRLKLVALEQKARQNDGREVGEAASLQALRQEIDSIQVALSEKEQMLSMSQAQCRTLEDAIEDRDKENDQLKRKLELLLSKTGGLDVSSEALNEAGFKFDTVAALAETNRESEASQPGSEESQKRSKLGRLFRKG